MEMIILGISGFEDIESSKNRHIYSAPVKSVDDLFKFSEWAVPLQFFPLHLIGHDSSAAILVDGEVVSAAAEERFSRLKHGFNLAGRTVLPRKAIAFCLEQAKTSWDRIDRIAHYCQFTEESVQRRLDKVSQNLNGNHRYLLEKEYKESYKNRLSREILLRQIRKLSGCDIPGDRLVSVRHHLAHAAGTFYSSDFQEALILTVDGYGEEESSLWCIGRGNQIFPMGSIELPTSMGLLYQVITAYLGFRAFGDEYKVMGLSSYGRPNAYRSVWKELIEQSGDGSYRIPGLSKAELIRWLKEHFPGVSQEDGFSQRKADIAASLQKALEKVLLDQLSSLKEKHKIKNLCLSGGVGLNACANGAIQRSGLFEKINFQPAAGDDGTSLGAALYVQHDLYRNTQRKPLTHVFLGPDYSSFSIENILSGYPQIEWERVSRIEDVAAEMLDQGKIVGWFQGRMEMGPRALGARSILADPRVVALRDKINAKIKNRESFRPFAPSVLAEKASEYFDIPLAFRSPFMLLTFDTRENKRSHIPAVVHVDGSARIQTVSQRDNPRFYRLLRRFYERTGIPVLLNTSFNRAGEPIVNDPEDALKCFLACGMDALFMENYLILPKGNPP
jgi:carbamoyltransferase